MDSFTRLLEVAVKLIERLIAALLVALIALALVGLVVQAAGIVGRHHFLDVEDLLHVTEHVLAVFIFVELFAIALAYLQGRWVIRTVLEAAMVAVARKLIAFEPGDRALEKGLSLAGLTLAVAAAWYLLHRIGVTEREQG